MLISTPARLDLLQFSIFFSLYRVTFVFMCSHIQIIYFKYENVSNKRLKIIIFVKHTFFIRTSKNFDEGQCSYFWMISVTIFSYFFIIFYETFLTHSRQKLRWNIWLHHKQWQWRCVFDLSSLKMLLISLYFLSNSVLFCFKFVLVKV